MVHGYYCGVQYEIYLNKNIDFFDDILPICISCRTLFSYELVSITNNIHKLIIIPYKDVDKRFKKKTIDYDFDYVDNFNKSGTEYYDVKIYKNKIKHNINEIIKITNKDFEELMKRITKLEEIYCDSECEDKYSIKEINELNSEYYDSIETIEIQRIIINNDYFLKIKNIEEELTNIELTVSEKRIINIVLNEQIIKENIIFHGFNLIEGKC